MKILRYSGFIVCSSFFYLFIGLLLPDYAKSQTVTEFSSGIAANCNPRGITSGPDGNLWFTEDSGNSIGRITPSGVITVFSSGLAPNSYPWGITSGPDGNLWFTVVDGIGRITPSGVITVFSAGLAKYSGPIEITAGPDGNLWFTDYDGGAIGRITPSGVFTVFSTGLTANSGPQGITTGPDGNLWFTEYNSNTIGRLTDIRTGCAATLDQSLILNIPHLSYTDPISGTLSYWANFVYETATFPSFTPFKLTTFGIINHPSFSCAASTLYSDLSIHIPDVLLPDGKTHWWVDLKYSPTLSINGNAYFLVKEYGLVSN